MGRAFSSLPSSFSLLSILPFPPASLPPRKTWPSPLPVRWKDSPTSKCNAQYDIGTVSRNLSQSPLKENPALAAAAAAASRREERKLKSLNGLLHLTPLSQASWGEGRKRGGNRTSSFQSQTQEGRKEGRKERRKSQKTAAAIRGRDLTLGALGSSLICTQSFHMSNFF